MTDEVACKLVVDLQAHTETMVPLTAADIAQRALDAADADAAHQQFRALVGHALVARCDRYLAQTDWIMLPVAARPVDMAAADAASIDATQADWRAWRAAIKKVREQLVAGTIDPFNPPALPAQPAMPDVVLT